jgi:DNA-binding transcriptional regulator YiaG
MATNTLEIAKVRQMIRTGRARAIREQAGVSQNDVALELDVTVSTVSRWERAERSPRGEVAQRYGQLLRSLSELV